MAVTPSGDWRSKAVVGLIVAVIGVALYPTVVVPLQIAYGGRERPTRDPALAPAFSKKGMWGEIESAAKRAKEEGGRGEASGGGGGTSK